MNFMAVEEGDEPFSGFESVMNMAETGETKEESSDAIEIYDDFNKIKQEYESRTSENGETKEEFCDAIEIDDFKKIKEEYEARTSGPDDGFK